LIYSSFENSISWVINEIFDQTDQRLWDPVLNMAGKIKLAETCQIHECLLEFHHDIHLAIDISFGVLSSAALLPKEFMPTWWDLYVDRCDQIVPNTNPPEGINTSNASTQYRKKNTSFDCALPDFHYLEFDVFENSIRLGGVFQRLDNLETEVPAQMLNEILDYCLAVQGRSTRTNNYQKMMKDIFESLGCPYWIGLMIGRGEMVKLIFKSSVSLDNIKPNFWKWFTSEFRISFENTMKYFSSLEHTSVRCCIDLCLSNPSNHPRLCFEIFPSSRVKESTSWSILNCLKQHFNLSENLRLQICNLYANVPRGVRKTPFSHIFPCPQLPFNNIAAVFSHYKICLEKNKPAELKTYAHVISEL